MNLSAVDVNLLIVLDALIETTSVTRAGVRVGLSQPATSHALGRLRELFNDELLVRHGRSMVLTPRAEELGLAVRKWRALTEEVLSPSGAFVPSQARGTLTLAVADYALVTVAGPAVAELHRCAPDLQIALKSVANNTLRERLSTDADAALVLTSPDRIDAGLLYEVLATDDFVCVVREGHPQVSDRITLEAFCATPHLLISPRGDFNGAVDLALSAIGRSRSVRMVVPTFYAAPPIVASSDLLLNMNRRYASAVSELHGLRLLPPPLDLPVGSLMLVWHPRVSLDPKHRWARASLAATVRSLTGNGGPGAT